jgi:hypothetical protein
MLAFLRGRAGERKLRLFACACYRRVWPDPPPLDRNLVEIAEKIAEGAERPPFDLDAEDYARGGAASTLLAPDAWEVVRRVAGGARAAPFAQANLLRDIFGNPFRPVVVDPRRAAWNNGLVLKLARTTYDDRAFDRLPVLADALEDAGCSDAQLLGHLRGSGPHVRGCWALDLILAKE